MGYRGGGGGGSNLPKARVYVTVLSIVGFPQNQMGVAMLHYDYEQASCHHWSYSVTDAATTVCSLTHGHLGIVRMRGPRVCFATMRMCPFWKHTPLLVLLRDVYAHSSGNVSELG